MKRYLLFLLILIIPFVVYAEDSCSPDSIVVESIDLDSIGNLTIEAGTPSFEGNKINLDLKVHRLGDNAKYKIVVKNTSDEDVEIGNDSLKIETEYFNYNIGTEDGTNIIKAQSSKAVVLEVKYENEVPDEKLSDGIFNEQKSIAISLSNGNEIVEDKSIIKAIEDNPLTSTGILLFGIVVISGLVILFIKKVKIRKYMIILIPFIVLIPYYVSALCKGELSVESNIVVDKNINGVVYSTSSDPVAVGELLTPHMVDRWCMLSSSANSCNGTSYFFSTPISFHSLEKCNSQLHFYTNQFTCEQGEQYNVGSNNYVLDKKDLSSDVYLKYDVENNIVKKIYTCMDREDQEYCLDFDGNTADDHSPIMNEVFPPNSCSALYMYFYSISCSSEDYYMSSSSKGGVTVSNSSLSCRVDSAGVAKCMVKQ